MKIWHLTSDTERFPRRVSPGESVGIRIGTWPVEPGQSVWVSYDVRHAGGQTVKARVDAAWQFNERENSYWNAFLGPFDKGDLLTYTVEGRSPSEEVLGPTHQFRIGPKLYLALMWHQHQPVYKDTSNPASRGSYIHPWVRLHAIRDYYSMAALVEQHPDVHLTINLTPSLLAQIEDYVDRGATDRALELTLKPAGRLSDDEREVILSDFFDAHWHNQIFPYPRYKELFEKRQAGHAFSTQDVRDLQMWFNLAWFAQEFRTGEVRMVTGETVSVHRFVEQGLNFSIRDIQEMVECQYTIMKGVIPIHRRMQDAGQVEVSTSPYYHPILPLLVDTDQATIDRPGATLPRRFTHPEDADAHVRMAIESFTRWFGRPPRGMWPAEGAVSQNVVPIFARHGIRWIATDERVLARSGQWGYKTDEPNILCQPYRTAEAEWAVSTFFRNAELSDAIGFRYNGYSDYSGAAMHFLQQIKNNFAFRLAGDEDRVLSVILDGENAWGDYREDARPFLHALYSLLESDPEVQTVTFSEYIDGNRARGIAPHPLEEQVQVYDLFTGSWADESGSAPGVDLGTWIGEEEENRAWELLANARSALVQTGATPEAAPEAFQALYMAEASDWFWWFGEDQESDNDGDFDDLFRDHLKNVYRGLGQRPPAELDRHIVPHPVVWTFTNQARGVQPRDLLTIRINCPGMLTWQLDEEPTQTAELLPAGGVMAGLRHYHTRLGPFPPDKRVVRFSFRCTCLNCPCHGDICCRGDWHAVES